MKPINVKRGRKRSKLSSIEKKNIENIISKAK